MHTKRLFLPELTDEHLTLLLRVVQYSDNVKVEDWLRDIQAGLLAVYELDSRGIIGLRRYTDCIFVEFIVGKNLKPIAEMALAWLKDQAEGKRIEIGVMYSRPALIHYYQKLGFMPTFVTMRLGQ